MIDYKELYSKLEMANKKLRELDTDSITTKEINDIIDIVMYVRDEIFIETLQETFPTIIHTMQYVKQIKSKGA